MYRIIANTEKAQATYKVYVQIHDPDCPEPRAGSKINLIKKLNELINENIDEWFYNSSTLESLKDYYVSCLEEDDLGISELLYELFTKYIPASTYVNVDIMDKYGNVMITVEE